MKQFEIYLKKDRGAKHLLENIVKKGYSRSRIILLLEAASDPSLKERARQDRRSFQKLSRRLFSPHSLPPRKQFRALADRLDMVANELKSVFGNTLLALSPDAQYFRGLAANLLEAAYALRQKPVPVPEILFSYRVFLKHVPIAMLCKELRAPRSVSFVDIEKLLYVAACVRGVKQEPADRYVEMQFNRLMKRPIAKLLEPIADFLLASLDAIPRD